MESRTKCWLEEIEIESSSTSSFFFFGRWGNWNKGLSYPVIITILLLTCIYQGFECVWSVDGINKRTIHCSTQGHTGGQGSCHTAMYSCQCRLWLGKLNKIIHVMHLPEHPKHSKSYINALIFVFVAVIVIWASLLYNFVHRKFLISYDFCCIILCNILCP